MKKDNERRTVVSVGEKITRVNVIDDGNAVEIFSVSDCKDNQDSNAQSDVSVSKDWLYTYFPIVKASTLSLDDDFLKHEPKTKKQSILKARLITDIYSGLTDFRAQRMDPSLDYNGNIIYEAGGKPAVGKSPSWWNENAKKFMPKKGSRQGTVKERSAFLGLLIKYLIETEKYTVSDAWKAVCDQSKELGHYSDSEDAKHNFESTASRIVGEWYDLANTHKIIGNLDKDYDFFYAGGCYFNNGSEYPLASASLCMCYSNTELFNSVGWIVLDV